MEILLQSREMLVLKGERLGLMVKCGAGILWITQEGDARDHLVKPGREFKSSLPGRIVVTALADSRLSSLKSSPVTGRCNWALPSEMVR